MIKKLTFSLLIALLFLTACGTATDETNQDENKATEQTDETNAATNTEEKEGEEQVTTNGNYPQLMDVQENERVVVMETTKGNIKIKLFPDLAPKTVENFITHSENGYYDGLIFHRVIRDFMIQGGDPQGTGVGGESIWGQPFEDEVSNKLYNIRGALSMANSGPNTNGSQFFIVQSSSIDPSLVSQMEQAGFPKEIISAYEEKGGTPWLDFKHTVFGQVIEGMDVVDAIATAEVGANDKPVEDIVINKITIVK